MRAGGEGGVHGPQLLVLGPAVGHGQLRGDRGRGRSAVAGELRQRHVGLVSHAHDDRARMGGDGAHDRLVVEGPQVLKRASATGHDDDVDGTSAVRVGPAAQAAEGPHDRTLGTLALDPKGPIAMRGELYPITEIGLKNLVVRLLETAENDVKYGECEVKYYKGAKVNRRSCTCIEVIHPVPRSTFLYHKAQLFVDDEYNVVTRCVSWDWPKNGAAPELIEEYNYVDLKFNVGLTDGDFDIRNPNYKFK